MGGIGNRRESLECVEFEKNERKKSSATAQKNAQKNEKSMELLKYCSEPWTRGEMMEFLGIKHRTTFRNAYIKPLLDSGKLFMMYPEKPCSKNPKFYSEQ